MTLLQPDPIEVIESLQQRFDALDQIAGYLPCSGCNRRRSIRGLTMCRTCCETRCTHVLFAGLIIATNGARQPWQRCVLCGLIQPPARAQQTLPLVFRDNRPHFNRPCERCGRRDRGVEFHHWAPHAIFADADDWPLGLLCPPCHGFWHRTMRQAGGYQLATPTTLPDALPTASEVLASSA